MSNGPSAALELQPSEAHVLAAASRLLAAYIAAGKVSRDTFEIAMEQSIRQAIEMARRLDRILQSDDETPGLGPRPEDPRIG